MNHIAEHSHHGHAEEMPFSEQEIKYLHAQDVSAATYVVGLLVAIFCIGVVIYTIVAISTLPG